MAIDYFRLLERLDPKQDAEDVVRLRKGTIEALNADGTVSLGISGIVVPNIPTLAGLNLSVGQRVYVATSRGMLLVIGAVPGTSSDFYWTSSNSASSTFGTTDTTVLALNSVVFRAGRAYRVEFHGGWNDISGAPTLFNVKLKKTNSTGTLWLDFGWLPMVAGVIQLSGGGATGFLRRTASTDLTADVAFTAAVNTGTANMFANATLSRWLEIKDCGAASKYTGIFDVT